MQVTVYFFFFKNCITSEMGLNVTKDTSRDQFTIAIIFPNQDYVIFTTHERRLAAMTRKQSSLNFPGRSLHLQLFKGSPSMFDWRDITRCFNSFCSFSILLALEDVTTYRRWALNRDLCPSQKWVSCEYKGTILLPAATTVLSFQKFYYYYHSIFKSTVRRNNSDWSLYLSQLGIEPLWLTFTQNTFCHLATGMDLLRLPNIHVLLDLVLIFITYMYYKICFSDLSKDQTRFPQLSQCINNPFGKIDEEIKLHINEY